MELKNNKSALAALATLGVTAIAAGTTAFLKIRKKRREQKQEEEKQQEDGTSSALSADQMMVYNEAVQAFQRLNDRIYELRNNGEALQPLIQWLATDGERPATIPEALLPLADDIDKFLTQQMPFINACLSTINHDGLTFIDFVHAPVGGTFDSALDELSQDTAENGTPIKCVLRLGYFFPDSTIAPLPVKSIVTV